MIAGVSLAFEIVQYVLAPGSSAATDIFVDIIGGLFRYLLIAPLQSSARPRIWRTI